MVYRLPRIVLRAEALPTNAVLCRAVPLALVHDLLHRECVLLVQRIAVVENWPATEAERVPVVGKKLLRPVAERAQAPPLQRRVLRGGGSSGAVLRLQLDRALSGRRRRRSWGRSARRGAWRRRQG